MSRQHARARKARTRKLTRIRQRRRDADRAAQVARSESRRATETAARIDARASMKPVAPLSMVEVMIEVVGLSLAGLGGRREMIDVDETGRGDELP